MALVLTLAVVAIPSIKSFTEGGKQGAAARNASALNSAVAQYDQSGGLLTAKVTVPGNVASLPVNELPELKVLSLLREADGGSLVSAWQEPIFDDEGYRVVWRNDLPEDQKGVTTTLGGEGNDAAEILVASGDGGRFELLDPTEEMGRKGIIGFQQGGLLVASIEPETEPSPTPPPANSNPAVTLTASSSSPKVGDLVTYYANGTDADGDNLTYAFNHIGGTEPAGSSSTFSRPYSAIGTFSVSVNVTDGRGGSAQASIPVTVGAANAAPVVSLSVSAPQPFRNKPFTYTAAATDPNGGPLTYRFIYNGAIVQEGANPVYVATYPNLGNQLVTVVAIDSTGLSNSADLTATVLNQAPNAGITVDPLTGYRGQVITFTASGSDLDRDGLTYSFDGGAFGGNTIQKTYPTVGSYSVSVRSNDGMNQPNSVSSSVSGTVAIVNRMPSVTLVVNKPTGVRGDEFTFTATGSDPDNDAIAYSFKVGRTGTWSEYKEANEFKLAYTTVGKHKVFVQVRDSLGGISDPEVAFSEVEIINRAPLASLSVNPKTVSRNNPTTLQAVGSDADQDPIQFRFQQNGAWSSWGGQTSHSASFAALGLQPVTVQVRDSFGALVDATDYVDVIRNLAFYWNQSADPARIYSINTSGTGDQAVLAVLQKANAGALDAALRSLGSTSTSWSEQGPVATTTSVQISDVPWSGGHSWTQSLGHVQLNNGGGRSRNKERGRAMWWGYADHSGHWRRTATNLYGGVHRTTWTTTYYHQVTNHYAQSFASGFVMLDQDTGEVLETMPASQWGAIAKGNIAGGGTNRGVVASEFAATGRSQSTTQSLTNQTATSSTATLTTYNYMTYGAPWSPLTVSFGDPNSPDYLAGSDSWKKNGARQPVLAAMREFDLDLQGKKMWEWVGPDEGLLVFNPEGKSDLKVTGAELFGNSSFGKSWSHGFAPLASLDVNKDGRISDAELKQIWIWRDKNSDAEVQDGELAPASSTGIVSLAVTYTDDGQGGLMNAAGATMQDGKNLPVRDWWSMGGMPKFEYTSFIMDVLSTPAIYSWKPIKAQEGIEGGIFRFAPAALNSNGAKAIVGFSTANGQQVEGKVPALSFMVEAVDPLTFGWQADMGDGLLLTQTRPIVEAGRDFLLGNTAVASQEALIKAGEDGKPLEPVSYNWKAERLSGPSFQLLFDALVAQLVMDDVKP